MVISGERDEKRPGVRDLVRRGLLSAYLETASGDERRRLRAEAYEIVMPVLFQQLTRKIEVKRGHRRCAASIHGLDGDCLDRFHNDMDAVLDDLFRHGHVPILNIEGWVRRRLTAVTVDAYRNRRGQRGALQRPRIPGWLAAKLNNDRRLMALAVDMLEFVGLEATAGVEIWPVAAWAAGRAAATGDFDAARRAVLRDIGTVLAAMRSRPAWFMAYVERPLGRKPIPLLMAAQEGAEPAEVPAVSQAARDQAADSRLTELAALAIAAIQTRLARGEAPSTVVVDVLTAVFGSGVGAEDLDRPPGESMAVDGRVVVGLADKEAIDRIVAVVLDILPGVEC